MSIVVHIEEVKGRLREEIYTSEAAVSQGILLPTLQKLGWPVFDPTVVIPEYSLEGSRVDFALCHPARKPSVFVEVKKVGAAEGADRQLFEYAFHVGVPMAILTDGQEWSFYLPAEQGQYDERRVYKLDLLERSAQEAGDRLERYLAYKKVCSGEALQSAREDYRDVTRKRGIKETIPKAWEALFAEKDSLLDVLARKVEDLCGYRPAREMCIEFLENERKKRTRTQPSPYPPPKSPKGPQVRRGRANPSPARQFVFELDGVRHEARSAKGVLITIYKELMKADDGFLERFATSKHGKKRRYVARDKWELYLTTPELAREHSEEIAPGWWASTNYSRQNIQQIIRLISEVADPKFRRDLRRVNVLDR